MAIDTMKKGSIEMLTLFLLCEEDAYGYQLVLRCMWGAVYPRF